MTENELEKPINFEDAFRGLFSKTSSGSDEEELLKIASDYALQITANQIRSLLILRWLASVYKEKLNWLDAFVDNWLELRKHNNSDVFVMTALGHISLRRFLNEQSFKVNIEKR